MKKISFIKIKILSLILTLLSCSNEFTFDRLDSSIKIKTHTLHQSEFTPIYEDNEIENIQMVHLDGDIIETKTENNIIYAKSSFSKAPFSKYMLVNNENKVLNQLIFLPLENDLFIHFSDKLITGIDINFYIETIEKGINVSITAKDHSEIIEVKKNKDINNSFSFKTTKSGVYKLSIFNNRNINLSVDIFVGKEYPYEKSRLLELNEQGIFYVSNQLWIDFIDQDTNKSLLTQYELSIIESSPVQGLLVEITGDQKGAKEMLIELNQHPEINYAYLRIIDTSSTNHEFIYPNDYTNWENSNANHHLKSIEMPKAWRYTGNKSHFKIGVSDGAFNLKHDELSNKVTRNYNNLKSIDLQDHGNGTLGTMIALTNNNKGIAGINWFSKAIITNADFHGLTQLAKNPEIKVINTSWAITGYVPYKFDITDSNQRKSRQDYAYQISRKFRRLAETHPDKLFVFSAGNGINNGKGFNGVFGIDGILHSPALHLDINRNVVKLDNVIFTAASNPNNNLYFYSNYGEVVDIAAPSNFISLSKDDYQNFIGTSASSPVVAGVASLLFDAIPDITPEQVKMLLINSSTQTIKSRQTNLENNVEQLDHSIPYLDANNALKQAFSKELDYFFIKSHVENPKIGLFELNFDYINPQINIENIQLDDKTDFLNANPKVTVDHNQLSKLIKGTLEASVNKKNLKYDFQSIISYALIDQYCINTEDNKRLSDYQITITKLTLPKKSWKFSVFTDERMSLSKGTYKVTFSKNGFSDYSETLSINDDIIYTIQCHLTRNDSLQVPFVIKGVANNNDIKEIKLYNNAYEELAKTDLEYNNNFYFYFLLPSEENKKFIMALTNKENRKLVKEIKLFPYLTNKINFDIKESDWKNNSLILEKDKFEFSGTWQPINPKFGSISNISQSTRNTVDNIFDRTFLLASNDYSYYFWTGDKNQGNYNVQLKETSKSYLTSPIIDLRQYSSPVLSFSTWWEVESQNLERDRMSIHIKDINTGKISLLHTIKKDTVDGLKSVGISNNGFQKEPSWKNVDITLNHLDPIMIRVIFKFDTVDEKENEYRGWAINNIKIDDKNQ